MDWTSPLTLMLLGGVTGLVIAVVVLVRVVRTQRHRLAHVAAEESRVRSIITDRTTRLTVLSHEIRTPLALAKGAGDLLAAGAPGPLTAHQAEFVSTIARNTDLLLELSETLLSEARLEANLLDLQLRAVDVRALVRETVRDLRRIHHDRLALDSRGAPVIASVDSRLMRQALTNMITNALRHGGPATRVQVRVTAAEESVLIAVTDDGAGMTAAERHRSLDSFDPVLAARRGWGLGMMLSRRIVELHGGQVFVDSIAKHGTTVLFALPLDAP